MKAKSKFRRYLAIKIFTLTFPITINLLNLTFSKIVINNKKSIIILSANIYFINIKKNFFKNNSKHDNVIY